MALSVTVFRAARSAISAARQGRGSVVPRSEIQFSIAQDGQVSIRNGAGPVREVLRGARIARFVAIANDLSLFGGVDNENRLWVQHGIDAAPEIDCIRCRARLVGTCFPPRRRAGCESSR